MPLTKVSSRVHVEAGRASIEIPKDWGEWVYLTASTDKPKSYAQLSLIHPEIRWFKEKANERFGNDWDDDFAKDVAKKLCGMVEQKVMNGPKGRKVVNYHKSFGDYTMEEATEFIERFHVKLLEMFGELPPIKEEQ